MLLRHRPEKLHLTKDEEFQLLKLIFDKFLWVGTIALLYGVYLLINSDVNTGLFVLAVGAIILLMFTAIVVRQFNYKKEF